MININTPSADILNGLIMQKQRTGSTHRINPDRFFHVMSQGWYIFTREGVQGPYDKRNDAESYITSVIGDIKTEAVTTDVTDSNNDWRM